MTRCTCPTHKGNPSPAPAAEKRLRAIVGELLKLQGDDVIARLGRIMRGDPLEKGGAGSGNFGHAGRPGEVGGSGEGVPEWSQNIEIVPRGEGLYKLEFKKGSGWGRWSQGELADALNAEGIQIENMTIRGALVRTGDFGKLSSVVRGGKTPDKVDAPKEEEESSTGLKIVQHERDIATGEMGRGWFWMPDGDLIDVTGDFGGGTNDHVGVLVFSNHPEKFGLDSKLVAKVRAEVESGDYDAIGTAWEKIYAAGIIRVRDFNLGKVRSISVDSLNRKIPLSKIQEGIRNGKIPSDRKASYVIDIQGYKETSYALLMSASSYSDLKEEKGQKSSTPPLLSPKWDERVVRATMPLLLGVFKAGGDEALGQIRKFPRSAKGMAWFPASMIERAERVVWKGEGPHGEEGRWVTMRGRRVFIQAGQEPTDALEESLRMSGEKNPPTSEEEFSSIDKIASDYNEKGVHSIEDVRIVAYRVGGLDPSRGIFLSGDRKGAEAYSSIHEGDVVKEYEVSLKKVLVAGHQDDLTVRYFGRHYGELADTYIRRNNFRGLDKAIMQKAKGEGFQGIIYTRPAPPAKNEIMVFSPRSLVERTRQKSLSQKASEYLSFDDFMDRYMADSPVTIASWIDQPEVVQAAEREAYQFAQQINQTTADALREVIVMGMENGDSIKTIANSISNLSDEWAEGWRAEMIARTETARVYTSGRIEAWRATGVVKRKVWSAADDACPFCRELDGTVVDLDKPFFKVGETAQATWNGEEILMDIDYMDIDGPPLHPNCRCAIVGELDYEALDQGGETLEEILSGDVSKSVKAKNDEGEEGRWVTMRGHHVFIREGQSMEDAIAERFGKAGNKDDDSPKSTITEKAKAWAEHVEKIAIDYLTRGDSRERGWLINSEGDVVATTIGTASTSGKISLKANCVFTHSHPSGDTLSGLDVVHAANYKLMEMRACNPDGTYRLGPPKGGWTYEIANAIEKHIKEHGGFYNPKFEPREIADKFGLFYQFDKIDWKTIKSVKGQNDEGEEGRWVTMRGRRVFIREGQDPAEALQESLDAMRPDTPATFHPGPDKENPAKGGKWTLANGKPLPEHVGNIRPDLTNVRVSMDPEASMIWIGKDSAGRDQKKYKASVTDRNKAAKFARTHELIEKKPSILKENEGNLAKPETAEEALVTKLIFATGMRPGSTKDTKAEKQAYGATTLLAEHVKKSGDGVVLSFVGKSGKDLTIPVEDRSMAKVLLERKARGGKLFGTSEAKVLGYVHGLDGGKFKTKDIRTAVGTETALNKIKQMPAPKSMKEYKASVKEVAVAVSTKLGNTPTIALQSYISPVVFAPWRQIWEGEKLVAVKGGPGSGHFGHSGRPGEVGGSGGGGLPSGFSFIYPEEGSFDIEDEDSFLTKIAQIVNDSGIAILRDKDLHTVIAGADGQPKALLYTSFVAEEYSFDVIVDKTEQGKGLASILIDRAISEGRTYTREIGGKIVADVVNNKLISPLQKRGFVITDRVGGHTLMEFQENTSQKSYASFDKNTEVQFGEVEELPDWRKVQILDDEDPDDEELEQTPQDVVEVLGFDPLELEEGVEEKGGPGSGHFGHAGRPGEVGGSGDGDRGFVLEPLEMVPGPIGITNNDEFRREWERPSDEREAMSSKKIALQESIAQLESALVLAKGEEREALKEHLTAMKKENQLLDPHDTEAGFAKDQAVRAVSARIPDSVDLNPLESFSESLRYEGSSRISEIQNITDTIFDTWANSASDHNVHSLEVQKAIAEEFKTDSKWIDKALAVVSADPTRGIKPEGRAERIVALRAFVRAMYDNTQEHLQSAGIEKVTAFRGFRDEDGIFKGAKIPWLKEGKDGAGIRTLSNPGSSWSTSLGTARTFAYGGGFKGDAAIIFKANIPRSRILSLATTGMGCLYEKELVVIGGKDWVSTWRKE